MLPFARFEGNRADVGCDIGTHELRGFGRPCFGPVHSLHRNDPRVKVHMVLKDSPNELAFHPAHKAANIGREGSGQQTLGPVRGEINNNCRVIVYRRVIVHRWG